MTKLGLEKILTYRVDAYGADALGRQRFFDAVSRRKLFSFAKDMGIETLVMPAQTDLRGYDALADEFGVNVAVLTDSASQVRVFSAVASHGKRIGIGIDTGLTNIHAGTGAERRRLIASARVSFSPSGSVITSAARAGAMWLPAKAWATSRSSSAS